MDEGMSCWMNEWCSGHIHSILHTVLLDHVDPVLHSGEGQRRAGLLKYDHEFPLPTAAWRKIWRRNWPTKGDEEVGSFTPENNFLANVLGLRQELKGLFCQFWVKHGSLFQVQKCHSAGYMVPGQREPRGPLPTAAQPACLSPHHLRAELQWIPQWGALF